MRRYGLLILVALTSFAFAGSSFAQKTASRAGE